MHPFTQRLAQRIEWPKEDTIADSLADAGEIMRIWRFCGGDPSGASVVGPYSEQTKFPRVRIDDVELLKLALVKFVRHHPLHPQLCSAVHALYFLADLDTKCVLVEILRSCIGRDSAALYQTILALEALGEDLYGSRESTSYEEVERNVGVARNYLGLS